ncbi:sulfatase [Glaciecola sp. KUL10]|uniref:sulfatase family protein n=1 Tax=Glaciecola sp. (strain KUL10) TaxID=2161813 RepID=UPI000D78A457|nr:sulfatase-like hydrolase/transferase [Glaciecola sp. KUL10]GBL04945.1 iduronate-sulfatase and sulfatase 1 [Glaciecola sp. KUL10]
MVARLKSIFVTLFLISITISFDAYSQEVRGFLQTPRGDINNFSVAGWACQIGNSESIEVSLYAGNDLSPNNLIQTIKANRDNEQAVRDACGSEGYHRFKFDISPETIYLHSGKPIVARAFIGSKQRVLTNGTNPVYPVLPETSVKGIVDGIGQANSKYFLMGWACQPEIEVPVRLTAFTQNSSGEVKLLSFNHETSTTSEPSVSQACDTSSTKHRFRIPIEQSVVDEFAGRPVHVLAEDSFGSSRQFLFNSGKINIPATAARSAPASKPNILIFFTDDQGFADLGIQNVLDDVKTPNIDSLAQNGVQFTNGYITAPQCSPSRAGLLAGRYQQRFKLDENSHIPMSIEQQTIAERFKAAGYNTGAFGKWHLEIMNTSKEWGQENYPEIQPFVAGKVPLDVQLSYFPHERGFDDMFVGYTGSYWRNVDLLGRKTEVERYSNNTFRVDLTTEATMSFIDKNWQRPFFAYVAHYAPHVPLEAPQEYLDRFPEDMPERRRYALAMMSALDDGVGKIIDQLKTYNILDNTLIMFISDNGAPLGDDMTDAPIANRNEAWNGSLNTPFTGEKGMLTEGALRVPFIVQWPNMVESNQVIDTPVSSLDAAYTALKVAEVEELQDLDGVDLLPLVTDNNSADFDDRALFWRFYFQRAVRQGDWKYMQIGLEREYLFDMTKSEPESVNLISENPGKADELRALYWQWSAEMPREETLIEAPLPFLERVDRYLPTGQ